MLVYEFEHHKRFRLEVQYVCNSPNKILRQYFEQ